MLRHDGNLSDYDIRPKIEELADELAITIDSST